MRVYLFGREAQNACQCGGRTWRILWPDEQDRGNRTDGSIFYTWCPLCRHPSTYTSLERRSYYKP